MKSNFSLMTLMILLTAFSSSGQTTLGFTAGASFSNVAIKAEEVTVSPKSKAGITAGIVLDAPISANFSFQPALNFVQKGYKMKDETVSETVNLNYLEVPLNFVYAKKNEGFFIGAGPSFSYGISGMDKFKSSDASIPSDNEKVKFGSGADEIKPLDFGLNALIGYKLSKGLIISGSYNLGLSKINNDEDGEETSTIKNKYFSIKIGYLFGSKK